MDMSAPPGGLALIGNVMAWAIWGMLRCIAPTILSSWSTIAQDFTSKAGHVNWILVAASITIFFLTTASVLLLSVRLYVSLFDSPTREYSGFILYTTGPPVYGVAIVLECSTMLVADAVLIWRAWLLYNRRCAAVVLNIVLWLITLGCTAYLLTIVWRSIYRFETGVLPTFITVNHWTVVVETLMLLQNAIATFLIVFRLWRVGCRASRSRHSSFMPFIWLIIESCATYTVLWIVVLSPSAANYEPGILVTNQLVTPVIVRTLTRKGL
ncbi:hypothetical protein CALCODRAFT_513480 [Calocera cornea HHB12733]|uniref:Uncharacterized protein n=1 Tax=Calocera cornea HHB12733 TaxID=1353952 RepID=A0A165C209_9BASI|nr:hypothetical protein CALCODRAFT_513480 [Calocera cornea HHB12733]